MKKITHWAVFSKTATGYSVHFPDVLGCISIGKNLEDAQKQAKEALELHIYGMEKDKEELPAMSAEPLIDEDVPPGYIISPITIFPELVKQELDNRRVKTNVTIPQWLKDVAETQNISYSKILETALIEYLQI